MRRKVLQDFANVFCQRLIDLPEGYDLASFAHHGSGKIQLERPDRRVQSQRGADPEAPNLRYLRRVAPHTILRSLISVH
jgi:hypothetical protein